MENKLDISIILPIKSATARDFDEFFDKAINSIKTQKVSVSELVIVHTDEEKLIDALNAYDFGDLNIVKLKWSKEPNYSKQLNYGVENANSTWVSFFEFDDEYSAIWFKNVETYINHYNI